MTEPLSDAEVGQIGYDATGDGWARRESSRLAIRDLAEVLEHVEQSAPAGWLIESLWPADAYGFLGAEDKAGKTWAGLDLAISVRSGTPWLGRFECPTAGDVLLFLGEGGPRPHLRRLEAIAKSKGLLIADLISGFRMSFAVPRLKGGTEVEEVRAELEKHPARLVVLDPFYLAAAGARGSDLFDMGAVLAGIQSVCQEAGAALVVTHHWNKTGEGRGATRFTGVGPGAWGRVLGSAAVESSKTDLDYARTSAIHFPTVANGRSIGLTGTRPVSTAQANSGAGRRPRSRC